MCFDVVIFGLDGQFKPVAACLSIVYQKRKKASYVKHFRSYIFVYIESFSSVIVYHYIEDIFCLSFVSSDIELFNLGNGLANDLGAAYEGSLTL